MIKYKYAQDKCKKLIDIHSLNEENRNNSKYFCLSCNNELIPRLGKIKEYHFAHKKVVTCSGETYLHVLGKKLFYENYKNCLDDGKSFFIEFYQNHTCNHYEQQFQKVCKLGKTINKYDLTRSFNKIYIEQREGSFIPDVMLESEATKEKIFIEIAVTHISSDSKVLSNYRIIEFDVEDEIDFNPMKERHLSLSNPQIIFRNFKIKEIIGSICKGNCEKQYNFFTLDKDGRALLNRSNLKRISLILKAKKEQINWYKIGYDCGGEYGLLYKHLIAKCASEEKKVNNCFICRYHADNQSVYENTRGVPIFCKFLKIKCNSNKAVECEYYKPDNKYIFEFLVEGEEIMSAIDNDSIDFDNEYNSFKDYLV